MKYVQCVTRQIDMANRGHAALAAVALLAIVCFVAPAHAGTPQDVAGPMLLEPLSIARRWMGAASASDYSSGFGLGRRDYFGFAGGDISDATASCQNSLMTNIDLYSSDLENKPVLKRCQGIGCISLSKGRSFASGVGVTFPPNTGPPRSGYLVFAGGLECGPNGNRAASAIVDVLALKTVQMLAPMTLPSGPRNYIATSSICKWISKDRQYSCLAFFAGGQGTGNTYTNAIDVLDLNPDIPVFLSPQKMTAARAFLASASFQDSMLFAGGKNESGLIKPIIVTALGQVDYFQCSTSNQCSNVDTGKLLSSPRFDLAAAGLSVILSDTTYRYAVFVGGTDQSNAVSNAIDIWTVIGDGDPVATTSTLTQARTAPTAAVIAKFTQKPIVVVTGGDSSTVQDGCQPATLAEFMVVDPSAAAGLKVTSTTDMQVNQVSVAASSEFWILQAGGVLSSNSVTANVAAFCYLCAAPPTPAPNVSPDASAATDLSPGSKAALAIFFITYIANIAGVVFYCREKAVSMSIPLLSAAVGWILCWLVILFWLPERDKRKLQERADLQSRML